MLRQAIHTILSTSNVPCDTLQKRKRDVAASTVSSTRVVIEVANAVRAIGQRAAERWNNDRAK